MKTLKTILLAATLIASGAAAQSATLAQLRDRIDAFATNKWPTLVARQQNYFVNRGQYWQGTLTHSVIPSHTSGTVGDSVGDRVSMHPDDIFEDWTTAFPEFATDALPCALLVTAYNGPQGQGWTLTVYVFYAGNLWTRQVNVGPETYRNESWHQLFRPSIAR